MSTATETAHVTPDVCPAWCRLADQPHVTEQNEAGEMQPCHEGGRAQLRFGEETVTVAWAGTDVPRVELWTSGGAGSPADARKVARALLDAADAVEAARR